MAAAIVTEFDTKTPDSTGTITGQVFLWDVNSSGIYCEEIYNKFKKFYGVIFNATRPTNPTMMERLSNGNIRAVNTTDGSNILYPGWMYFIAKGQAVPTRGRR